MRDRFADPGGRGRLHTRRVHHGHVGRPRALRGFAPVLAVQARRATAQRGLDAARPRADAIVRVRGPAGHVTSAQELAVGHTLDEARAEVLRHAEQAEVRADPRARQRPLESRRAARLQRVLGVRTGVVAERRQLDVVRRMARPFEVERRAGDARLQARGVVVLAITAVGDAAIRRDQRVERAHAAGHLGADVLGHPAHARQTGAFVAGTARVAGDHECGRTFAEQVAMRRELHDARHGVRSELGATGTRQQFHTLEPVDRNERRLRAVTATGLQPHAVDQHEHAFAGHAAQRHLGCPGAGAGDVDTRSRQQSVRGGRGLEAHEARTIQAHRGGRSATGRERTVGVDEDGLQDGDRVRHAECARAVDANDGSAVRRDRGEGSGVGDRNQRERRAQRCRRRESEDKGRSVHSRE